MTIQDFRAVTYPVRLYSGNGALNSLRSEVARRGAKRAFIVCGRSVSRKTPLIASMAERLGDAFAGVYDEMEKDSPLGPVLAARDAARDAGADLVIAVGGGSVIQATRVVVMLLAEKGSVYELCTQYPEGKPAQSVRGVARPLRLAHSVFEWLTRLIHRSQTRTETGHL